MTSGHILLLMQPGYASFMERFGQIGRTFATHPEAEAQLERVSWFTIEFGLMIERGQSRIFSAGILSSFGESIQILKSPIQILPFQIDAVLNHSFQKEVMQTTFYTLTSIDQLAESLNFVEEKFTLVSAVRRILSGFPDAQCVIV